MGEIFKQNPSFDFSNGNPSVSFGAPVPPSEAPSAGAAAGAPEAAEAGRGRAWAGSTGAAAAGLDVWGLGRWLGPREWWFHRRFLYDNDWIIGSSGMIIQ